MFLFRFPVRREPHNPQAAKAKGAFVNVYITYPDYAGAKELAELYMLRDAWCIEGLEEELELGEREPELRGAEHYREAKAVGYRCWCHCWGWDDPDDVPPHN